MTSSEFRPVGFFSPDGYWRYLLKWRTGVDDPRVLLFIGANPSRAGQIVDGRVLSDPTISRVHNLATELGFGELWAVNARAWVSTDPSGVPADPRGIGPQNDYWVGLACKHADLIVCGWGHLAGPERSAAVLGIIRECGKVPHALVLNDDGSPHHPRGIPSSARPFPMQVSS